MVAPPPNLTQVSGSITARRPHPTLQGWDVVSLAVRSTSPVAGLRDLVGPRLLRAPASEGAADEPDELEVAVRRELLGAAGPGWELTCRVKLTPNGLMAEQHPTEGFAVVEPG